MLKKTCVSALRQTPLARRVVFVPNAAAAATTTTTTVAAATRRQRCWLSSTTTNDLAVPPESRLSKDGVAGRPIDFDIQSKIEGNESQIVTITLEPGQVLRAESGGRCHACNLQTRSTVMLPYCGTLQLFVA
eukprot:scaffold6861_cov148-Amphora_coffeaeformis.AAC.5